MSNVAQTVERAIFLDADPEEVREALADEAFLAAWLETEVELLDGDERIAFRWRRRDWGESEVEIAVDAVAEGARVTVVETRLQPGPPGLLAAGWEPRLRRLPLLLGRLVLA